MKIMTSASSKKAYHIKFFFLVIDLESEYKKCEPEMLSVTIAAVVLTAVIVLALIYCQVNYSFRTKEKTAQIISSLRQSSSTTTSEVLDANNQTAVEVVVDAVTSPPPHSGSEHKGKNIYIFAKLNNVPLLYPRKTLENLRFSDVFRGCRSGILVEYGLNIVNKR